MANLTIGTKVKDRYALKEFKGSGSFGEVWLAHDEMLDTDVAIKIYISLDTQGVEEFKREYITTQGISHPNLLTTNYFDVWEQHPFLVMKYCSKGASANLIGRVNEENIWQFIHDVASGLNYLHNLEEPIIHRDIKPDNILVDDNNNFLITDFGISKKMRATMRRQSLRVAGAGATAYMGPELFDGNPSPVKASDIWSLGVSIYELATGELPFCGLGGGMQKNGAEMPSLNNKWSKDLNMVMQSCLAKETWDRPTAEQLEEYSEAILKCGSGKVDWLIPSDESGEEKLEEESGVGKSTDACRTGRSRKRVRKSLGFTRRSRKRIRKSLVISVFLILVIGCIFYFSKHKKEDSIQTTVNTVTENQSVEIDNKMATKEIKSEKLEENKQNTRQQYREGVKNGNRKISKNSHASIESTKMTTGSYGYSYGSYDGELKNGKPNGKGRLVFSSPHVDNMRGYSAEIGDYIDGFFTDGKLDHGSLFKKDGSKIKSIY